MLRHNWYQTLSIFTKYVCALCRILFTIYAHQKTLSPSLLSILLEIAGCFCYIQRLRTCRIYVVTSLFIIYIVYYRIKFMLLRSRIPVPICIYVILHKKPFLKSIKSFWFVHIYKLKIYVNKYVNKLKKTIDKLNKVWYNNKALKLDDSDMWSSKHVQKSNFLSKQMCEETDRRNW